MQWIELYIMHRKWYLLLSTTWPVTVPLFLDFSQTFSNVFGWLGLLRPALSNFLNLSSRFDKSSDTCWSRTCSSSVTSSSNATYHRRLCAHQRCNQGLVLEGAGTEQHWPPWRGKRRSCTQALLCATNSLCWYSLRWCSLCEVSTSCALRFRCVFVSPK